MKRARGSILGFTLIEVMLALSILAIALVGLIARTASNIRATQEMGMLDVATDLTRSKMYDLEDELLREGFPEMDKDMDGDFGDEGWPKIRWEATIEKIELPNLNALETMQEGEEGGEEGRDSGGGMLGGMLGMGSTGGTGEDEGGSLAGAGFLGAQFEMFSQVLEVSIRKVTLTVTWHVGQEEKQMVVACYFTDPAAMSQVIGGLGAAGGGVPGAGPGGSPGGSRGGGVPGGSRSGGSRSGGTNVNRGATE